MNDCYPINTRAAEAVAQSMKDFAGPVAEVKYFHSDGACELVKAATDLGWCHGTSTPGRSETNGVAEAAVKKVTYGTTTVLEHAGFESKWWPRAAKHFCFASCLNKKDGISPYNLRHGVNI